MTRLSGKIAIVTGSGGGIGQAIAQRFAVEGAHVWVTDINGETAEETVRGIKAAGRRRDRDDRRCLEGAGSDGARPQCRSGARTCRRPRQQRRHSRSRRGAPALGCRLDETARSQPRRRPAAVARRAAVAAQIEGARSIINISSIMAHRGLRPLAAYTATKGAVTALTKGLAVEYAPFNIRVNSIAPGYVETAITDRLLKLPPVKQALIDKTPMGRLGRPEDMTGAAVFFASDDSLYCTGSELAVDGGMAAGL